MIGLSMINYLEMCLLHLKFASISVNGVQFLELKEKWANPVKPAIKSFWVSIYCKFCFDVNRYWLVFKMQCNNINWHWHDTNNYILEY